MLNENNERTLQKPIHSGFSSRTTAREALGVKNLIGKVVIVTGGYSGLGLEITRVLAEAGATVIVPARRIEQAQKAISGIPRVELGRLNLMDPHSIDAFAKEFLTTNRPLDILVNCAGIMANPLKRDARGFESQFATNHLGHFQLTARLWPALVRANGARVVSLLRVVIVFVVLILTTPILEIVFMTNGKPMGNPRQQMLYLQLSWINEVRNLMYVHSLLIQERL